LDPQLAGVVTRHRLSHPSRSSLALTVSSQWTYLSMYAYADWNLKRRPQPIVMQRLPICLDSEKGGRGVTRAPAGRREVRGSKRLIINQSISTV